MSDSFANTTIKCPHCIETLRATMTGHQISHSREIPLLECSERNYQGCGVDVAHCPECGKGYQVGYYVGRVAPVESWNWETRAEREAREQQNKRDVIERKRRELAELEREE